MSTDSPQSPADDPTKKNRRKFHRYKSVSDTKLEVKFPNSAARATKLIDLSRRGALVVLPGDKEEDFKLGPEDDSRVTVSISYSGDPSDSDIAQDQSGKTEYFSENIAAKVKEIRKDTDGNTRLRIVFNQSCMSAFPGRAVDRFENNGQYACNPDSANALQEHAQKMWEAEETVAGSLQQRSRLTQTIAAAMLAFVSFGIFGSVARGGLGESLAPSTGISASQILSILSNPSKAIQRLTASGVYIVIENALFSMMVLSIMGGLLLVATCLCITLLHEEDEFRFPPRSNFADIPRPRRSWREVDAAYVVGESANTLLSIVGRTPRDRMFTRGYRLSDRKYTATERELYDNHNWMTPRPIVRRVSTASMFMQFHPNELELMYEELHEHSPTQAATFRAMYTSANSLRRWNQRVLDKLRRAERSLVCGVGAFVIGSGLLVIYIILKTMGPGISLLIVVGAASLLGLCLTYYLITQQIKDYNFKYKIESPAKKPADTGLTKRWWQLWLRDIPATPRSKYSHIYDSETGWKRKTRPAVQTNE